MENREYQKHDGPVGDGVLLRKAGPELLIKQYFADRPGHTDRAQAAELVVDITLKVSHPVADVWPVFKDFNRWMGRYGLLWDKTPADHEDGYVSLGGSGDLRAEERARSIYIVRKVIPGQLIYFDSQPLPLEGKEGVWTGNNIFSLHQVGTHSVLNFYMEHTCYSETLGIEELRTWGREVVASGLVFWCDYFVPDLIAAVESTRASRI
jgi:hypothetical protein